jgi:cellulose synthase/poly-beta-1,6-N-acetylglucosamine synthase-like glycosyltransferase
MSGVAAILAVSTLVLVAYVYVGYPCLLWLLSRRWRRPVECRPCTPSLTLIVSAFNEASTIRAKLENCLMLDYPRDSLRIVVVSDASNDGTDDIVRDFAHAGVELLRLPERRGKTTGLNQAVAVADSEILVFSDANILYDRTALRHLTRNFADPAVGCVTGDSRYVAAAVSAAHTQETTYWSYERAIRDWESQLGSTVGGDGAIFAIRRALYAPLAPEAINDLVTPIQIVARGHRAVFEPAAIGYEASAGDFRGEFRRKRRIVTRSWRGLLSVEGVLNPVRVGWFAWQVWSHKVLRWLVLPILLVAAGASAVAAMASPVFWVVVAGFVASLAAAALGALARRRTGRLARLAQAAFYFYVVNVAAVIGVAMAVAGRIDVVWAPQRASGSEPGREVSGVRERAAPNA